MMINANRFYSENYRVSLKLKELDSFQEFHTHSSIYKECLHRISEIFLLPARLGLQALAHIIEPLPGNDKNNFLKGVVIRVTALAFFLLNIPFFFVSVVVGLSARFIDHSGRPVIGYIDASKQYRGKKPKNLKLTKKNPLHVRTHNLGFVTTSMSTVGDLRSPKKRAKEVVKSITKDPNQPDVIIFQEVFHEDAAKILCNGIKSSYPYIIHSVAPALSGFSSGAVIASKYPLEKVDFEVLPHMLGPERLSPRGIIHVRLKSSKGPLDLYGIHTQALIGEARAKSRALQLGILAKRVNKDLDATKQIIVGDFNTSRVSVWGEDNVNQSEKQAMKKLKEHFKDPYLLDHHKITGKRIRSTPHFLKKDNERIQEKLHEPSGSWYHGPFADPGVLLSKKMRDDRKKYNYPEPKKASGVKVKPATWGTSKWRSKQTANTARFDYILIPKSSSLNGKVEIRRVIPSKKAQSAPTDHLPVDGRFWLD